MPVYNLVIGKNGSKLTESQLGPDKQNLLMQRTGPFSIVMPARAATMERFVANLQRSIVGRPVIDKTGLTGRYDFDMEFSVLGTLFGPRTPPPPEVDTGNAPDIFAAIEKLGLKLEPAKGSVETIVIDSVERPSDN